MEYVTNPRMLNQLFKDVTKTHFTHKLPAPGSSPS